MIVQEIGLGIVMFMVALISGYLTYRVVPTRHFPRTTGLLTANAMLGVLIWIGMLSESAMFIILMSPGVAMPLYDADRKDHRRK
jgi:hypothetical protein